MACAGKGATVTGTASSEATTISPTVGRRWLAQEIRRLREEAGLKQSDLAKRLRCGAPKIAHIESMRNPVNGPDLEVLLPFLGVPADRIDWYLRLADLAQEKGWWDGNRAVPSWFSLYIGLEWGASELHEWDMGFIPGLLQTPAYAEALLALDASDAGTPLDERIGARLQRQSALHREREPLLLHAIVDESAMHRAVGGEAVMREQMEHLIEMSEHPRVALQLMPFQAGPHRGQLGSFHVLRFPRDGDPGVVYLENQRGGLYLEEDDEVASFATEFGDLRNRALSQDDSAEFLVQRMKRSS